MQFSNEQIEQIMQQTFAGLSLFYRDTNLSNEHLSVYKTGMILRENGMTDASYRGGGMITKHRFLIASAHAKNAAMFEHGTNWGLVILKPGSFFKVLDVFESDGKTQITLLHVPDEGVDLFAQAKTNIEEDIIEKTRKSFQEKLATPPVPELTTEEWLSRTQHPVGLLADGSLQYSGAPKNG